MAKRVTPAITPVAGKFKFDLRIDNCHIGVDEHGYRCLHDFDSRCAIQVNRTFMMRCPDRDDTIPSSNLEIIARLFYLTGIAPGSFSFVNELNTLFCQNCSDEGYFCFCVRHEISPYSL
jgi:hypothetical protein